MSNATGIVVDVEYDMEFRIMKAGFQIFVNGVIIDERPMNGNTRKAYDNVSVWASGDNSEPADAKVTGLWSSDLSGDEEFSLCIA